MYITGFFCIIVYISRYNIASFLISISIIFRFFWVSSSSLFSLYIFLVNFLMLSKSGGLDVWWLMVGRFFPPQLHFFNNICDHRRAVAKVFLAVAKFCDRLFRLLIWFCDSCYSVRLFATADGRKTKFAIGIEF